MFISKVSGLVKISRNHIHCESLQGKIHSTLKLYYLREHGYHQLIINSFLHNVTFTSKTQNLSLFLNVELKQFNHLKNKIPHFGCKLKSTCEITDLHLMLNIN